MATFGWQRFPQMNSDSYPGIGRLGYFGAQVIFLIGGIALAIAMPKAYLTDPVSASLFFFAGVIGFALHIMRLHNAGASGWIALGLLIPFGGLLVMLFCLIAPPGYCEHRQMDAAGGAMVAALAALITIVIALLILG